MLDIKDEEIFEAVHQNHENAGNRTVIYIPTYDLPKAEKIQAPQPQPDPRESEAYQNCVILARFALAIGFILAAMNDLIHPVLGSGLALACVAWALCYWADKRVRWQL